MLNGSFYSRHTALFKSVNNALFKRGISFNGFNGFGLDQLLAVGGGFVVALVEFGEQGFEVADGFGEVLLGGGMVVLVGLLAGAVFHFVGEVADVCAL